MKGKEGSLVGYNDLGMISPELDDFRPGIYTSYLTYLFFKVVG